VDKEDEIRLIAYNIWQQEGRIKGKDCEDWLRAEAIWEQRRRFMWRQKRKLECVSKQGPDAYLTPKFRAWNN
jgi:hypothetical protein